MNRIIIQLVSLSLVFLSFVSALAGCFVVPTTKTTIRSAGTESAVIQGPARGLDVDAKASHSELTVRATTKRECERQTVAVTEVTAKKTARYSPSKDPRAGLFAAVLAPITLPVSAIVTGIAVATSSAKTTKTRRVVQSEKFACVAAAASFPVTISLPSGQIVEGTTDTAGELAVAIPISEPYTGAIIVKAGTETRTVDYSRPIPAVTALREAARSCATRLAVTSAIRLDIDVDHIGASVDVHVDAGGPDLATCVGKALAGVRFPEAHRDARLVLRYKPGSL